MKYPLLLLVSLAVTGTLIAEEPLVVIQVVVDAGYKDTPKSLKQLENTLAAARIRTVTAKPADNIADVVLREYGFGAHDKTKPWKGGNRISTAQAYKKVATAIAKLNGYDFANAKSDGEIYVPDIPEWALSGYNPAKQVNYVPKIARYEFDQLRFESTNSRLPPILSWQGDPQVSGDKSRRASQKVRFEYTVPASIASQWAELPSFTGKSFNFPIEPTLADPGDAQPTVKLLKTEDVARIRTVLAHPLRHSTVFILDSGWPDQNAADHCREVLLKIINAVRSEKLNLPPLSMLAVAVTPPHNPHCSHIQAALDEFSSLDKAADGKHAVDVVYIPLSQAQAATALLKELVRTNYLYDLISRVDGKVLLEQSDFDDAELQTSKAMKNIPLDWTEKQTKITTDKSIIDAVLNLANFYFGQDDVQESFFVNESWTVPSQLLSVTYPPQLRGAVVAATGNFSQNTTKEHLDFAQRCVPPKDTVAVMNVDDSGIACNSGTIDITKLPNALVVGFSGRIAPGDCDDNRTSGTSYSAPRVAWLFAAAETIRKEPLDPSDWPLSMQSYCRSLRSSKTTLEGTRLDPLTFLSGVNH